MRSAFPAAAAASPDWLHRPSKAFDVIGGEARHIDRRIIRVKLAWSSSIIQRKNLSEIPSCRRWDVYKFCSPGVHALLWSKEMSACVVHVTGKYCAGGGWRSHGPKHERCLYPMRKQRERVFESEMWNQKRISISACLLLCFLCSGGILGRMCSKVCLPHSEELTLQSRHRFSSNTFSSVSVTKPLSLVVTSPWKAQTFYLISFCLCILK